MGCDSSSSIQDLEDIKEEEQKNNNKNNQSDKKNNSDKKEKDEEEEKTNKNNKNEDNKDKKKLAKKDEKRIGDVINTEENKDDEKKDLSNIMTEGVVSNNGKLNLHKQNYEGVILMKGVEECFPEDLNEDDVYQLVENALNENKDLNKIEKEQAKAISSILYNKIHKKGKINIKDYPELKGINVKIGFEKLTREVIKNMMFNNKKVDDCQIDLTYANLTKDNDDIKALTIEILP